MVIAIAYGPLVCNSVRARQTLHLFLAARKVLEVAIGAGNSVHEAAERMVLARSAWVGHVEQPYRRNQWCTTVNASAA